MFFEVLVFVILSSVVGLMFLFFGYPFFRILLPIFGFFVGLAFGYNGLENLLGTGFITGTLGLILGVVLGLVFAALAYFFYELVVVLFGVAVGYVLGAGFMMALGFDQGFMTVLVGIVTAVVLGMVFVMVAMPKFLVVLFTAGAGAMAIVMGLMVLFGQVPEAAASLQLTKYLVQGSFWWLVVWGVLTAVGLVFQYALVSSTSGEDMSGNYDFGNKSTKSKKKK